MSPHTPQEYKDTALHNEATYKGTDKEHQRIEVRGVKTDGQFAGIKTGDFQKDENGQPIHPDIQVVETEEQAKALLLELQKEEDPKVLALKKQQALAMTLKQMDAIWKGMSRKEKRKVMNKRNSKLKFSARAKAALQQQENNPAPVKYKAIPAKKGIHVGEGMIARINTLPDNWNIKNEKAQIEKENER